jgi:ankyrin repeat protein
MLIAAVKEDNLSMLERTLNMGDHRQIRQLATQCDHRDRTALHWAAKLGRATMLKMLVSWCDINAKDTNGRTAIFYAVQSKAVPLVLVEILLLYGARVKLVDNGGKTPLRLALEKQDLALVARLAKVDDITLLTLASRCGRDYDSQHTMVQMVETLVECGADLEVTDDKGRTILHIAAAIGCMAIVKLLKPSKAMVETLDVQGESPLSLSAFGGWLDVAEYLLGEEWKANLEITNYMNWTPLHHAAAEGHKDFVDLILDKGANPFARTRSGHTPLSIACLRREDEIGVRLLEKMTIPQAVALHDSLGISLARIAAMKNCEKVMKMLIEYAKQESNNYPILSEKVAGCSHAFIAIQKNCHNTAIALLEAGAIIEGVSVSDDTALHCAARKGNATLVTWLLEHNTQAGEWSIMKNQEEQTPIEIAAIGLEKDVISAFLRHQDAKHVESTNTAGWTELHWAIHYERLDLIRLLITNGADTRGETAADIARRLKPASKHLLKWLTLADPQETTAHTTPLERPIITNDAEHVCKAVPAFLVDLYGRRTVEKYGFSIHEVLYHYGPEEIMSIAAKIAAKAGRIEDRLGMRWIHLPMNNVSRLQQEYYP